MMDFLEVYKEYVKCMFDVVKGGMKVLVCDLVMVCVIDDLMIL